MTSQANHELPLTYRADVVSLIFQAVAAGDSCSIVGIGSVGKSNLLRFLQRNDVREAQLGDDWATYLFVYVDLNKILRLSRWGLFELMLHQLLIELTNQGVDQKTLDIVDDLHERATDPQRRYLALRYLDRAMRLVCHELGLHVVFLFDEFDEVCRQLAAEGFSALRALRDDYKYQVMYVVATRLELKRLRQELKEIEAFEELVSSHTIWLGPYTETDARYMLHRLEERHKISLDEKNIMDILGATGGHPGLLREGYNVVRKYPGDFFEMLNKNPQIQAECQRIWLSLSSTEQQAVSNLVQTGQTSPQQAEVLDRLRYKGLVRGKSSKKGQLFSSFFAAYIKHQNPDIGTHIHVDDRSHTVSVNGHEIRKLTPLEYKLIAYLAQKRGQLCTRDELAQHLYPDDMVYEASGVADSRLDSLVKRLRKRIEPNAKEPRYILTVRGHGFRLADGEGIDGTP